MDNLSKIYKMIIRISYAIVFILLFVAGYAIYEQFFGVSKIVQSLEKNSEQLGQVIQRNKLLEERLVKTQLGISEVHKSLLESQIKLTTLIKDTRGSSEVLEEHVEEVQNDLEDIIHEIDSVLTSGQNLPINDISESENTTDNERRF